jgi:DNA polymerase III epsilon subunit-like protein
MIICIDLETTGLDRKKDRIIEIAMVGFDEESFEVKKQYSRLIYPGTILPELISNITHIFDEDLE